MTTNEIPTAGTGEAPTEAGAPPLTTRSVDRVVDSTSALLRDGAAELGIIDRAGIPTDVRDLARSAAAYGRLVARHLDDARLDAGDVDDLLHLGEIVSQHAALTDAAGAGRPAIRLAAASARWFAFAAQLPLADLPVGDDAVATAITEAVRRARLVAHAPDTSPEAWCTVHGCSSIAPCPKHVAAATGVL